MAPTNKIPMWEDIIIILSIGSLWPAIIGRESIFSRLIIFVAFGLLIWILVRRISRIRVVKRHDDR